MCILQISYFNLRDNNICKKEVLDIKGLNYMHIKLSEIRLAAEI